MAAKAAIHALFASPEPTPMSFRRKVRTSFCEQKEAKKLY
jgi:hypothetical protein